MAVSRADIKWMDAAARSASSHLGTTKDNPTVGALVVDPTYNTLVSRAVTSAGGRPHAETQAIAAAGLKTNGATLYVTLEPCNHHGQTPPCVDAVIASGFSRVVVGQLDIDPRTAGKSVEKMLKAEIRVDVLDHHPPSAMLHRAFFHRVTTGRPFVSAKLALSADGMVGRIGEGNVPITGPEAKRWTHSLRSRVDGIAVGAKTFEFDQPSLNVRLKGLEDRSPDRFVFSNSMSLAQIHSVETTGGLQNALQYVGSQGINHLLVEGGPTLLRSLIEEGVVDEFHLLQSEAVVGANGQAAFGDTKPGQYLEAAGFKLRERRQLGNDRLSTYEKDH